jgi:hypothetical protein
MAQSTAAKAAARNAVERAIAYFGGLTPSVVATGFSHASWMRWKKLGFIHDARAVFLIADLTGLSPRSLAGFESKSPAPKGPGKARQWNPQRSACMSPSKRRRTATTRTTRHDDGERKAA